MEKEQAKQALKALRAWREPVSELNFFDGAPYKVVVAVLLSAQCLDKTVNKVTPHLFAHFGTFEALAEADVCEVEAFIKQVNFYKNKAKHLVLLAKDVVQKFGGVLPQNIEQMTALAGIGRKTAQVVQAEAFGVPATPVDTHVFRVSERIGITQGAKNTEDTEKALRLLYDQEDWNDLHKLLVLHGRYVCKAKKPECLLCTLRDVCIAKGE